MDLEIKLSGELSLIIRPGTPLATKASVSKFAALRAAEIEVAAALQSFSSFDDWAAVALEVGDGNLQSDPDELFVDYFRFCAGAGVLPGDRLNYGRFGRKLTQAGFEAVKDADGRAMRRGCRLIPYSLEEHRDVARGAELVTFLDAVCVAHGPDRSGRVKASDLFRVYAEWARTSGVKALTNKEFAREMKAAGYRQVTSNGRWWLGLALRPIEGAEPPFPLLGG